MTVSAIPDRHTNINPPSRAQFLAIPGSRGTVKSWIPSIYLSFSRFLHRILVKSRIPKIPFQTLFYDNFRLFQKIPEGYRRFPKTVEDFRRLTKRSDPCRRCPKNPPNISGTVNVKKLANLTGNTKNCGQITLNTKPHSDPL